MAANDEKALDRMMELRLWLYGLGACWHCRHEVASAEVIRELTGRRPEVKPCPGETSCLDVARAHWKERPMVNRLDAVPPAPAQQRPPEQPKAAPKPVTKAA